MNFVFRFLFFALLLFSKMGAVFVAVPLAVPRWPHCCKNCKDLLFVQCPSPRCGRKAPSLAEIGRKVTIKPNITIASTTSKPNTFQNGNLSLFTY
jgi:hypothetical protein